MRPSLLLFPALVLAFASGCSGADAEREAAEQGVTIGAAWNSKLVAGAYDTESGDSLVIDKGKILVSAGLYLPLDAPGEYFEVGSFDIDVDRESGRESIEASTAHHAFVRGGRSLYENVACKLELKQKAADVLVTGRCNETTIDKVFHPRQKDAFVGMYRRGEVTLRVESSDGTSLRYQLADQPSQQANFAAHMPGTAYSKFPFKPSSDEAARCGIRVRFDRFASKSKGPARAYVTPWDGCMPAAEGVFERVR